MEMRFFEINFKERKEDRIRNTKIIMERGVDELKNYIQKNRLRWFGYAKLMREERYT